VRPLLSGEGALQVPRCVVLAAGAGGGAPAAAQRTASDQWRTGGSQVAGWGAAQQADEVTLGGGRARCGRLALSYNAPRNALAGAALSYNAAGPYLVIPSPPQPGSATGPPTQRAPSWPCS
jgi:hypothetical protein